MELREIDSFQIHHVCIQLMMMANQKIKNKKTSISVEN